MVSLLVIIEVACLVLRPLMPAHKNSVPYALYFRFPFFLPDLPKGFGFVAGFSAGFRVWTLGVYGLGLWGLRSGVLSLGLCLG